MGVWVFVTVFRSSKRKGIKAEILSGKAVCEKTHFLICSGRLTERSFIKKKDKKYFCFYRETTYIESYICAFSTFFSAGRVNHIGRVIYLCLFSYFFSADKQ